MRRPDNTQVQRIRQAIEIGAENAPSPFTLAAYRPAVRDARPDRRGRPPASAAGAAAFRCAASSTASKRSCDSRCSGTARRPAHRPNLVLRSGDWHPRRRQVGAPPSAFTGRADAALGRAMAAERRAWRASKAVPSSRQPLHRGHGGALLHLADRHVMQAADLGAVEQHRAGAAIAGIAADFRPGQAEFVCAALRPAGSPAGCAAKPRPAGR